MDPARRTMLLISDTANRTIEFVARVPNKHTRAGYTGIDFFRITDRLT